MGQYKAGQWYRLEASHLRKPWYLKLLSEDDEWYLGEYIDDDNHYRNEGSFFKSYNYKLTETNLEEIQDYLPAGHVDKYIKKTKMKKFKNKLAVKGSKSLLKAFKEDLINLGYKWIDFSIHDCDYIVINTQIQGEACFNQTHDRADIKLFLPQDWDKALELAAEVEEEIPEYIEVTTGGGNNTSHPKHQKSVNNGIYKVLYFSKANTETEWDCYVCEGGYVIYPAYCKPSTKEAFDEQNKPKFKEGDWLYGKDDISEWIFKFKSYDSERNRFVTDEAYQFVINSGELIHEGGADNWGSLSKGRLATDEEVKRILIKVAKIKYPIGTKFKSAYDGIPDGISNGVFKITNNDTVTQSGQTINGNYRFVYYRNQWAEIVEESKLIINEHEVVKINEYNVQIGCQTFFKSNIEKMRALLNIYGGTYVFKDKTKWTANDLDKILSVFD